MQKNIDFNNLKVDAFTTPCLITMKESETISRAMQLVKLHGIRHLPVLNENEELVGIVSDRDLRALRMFIHNKDILIKEVMTQDPKIINEGELLIEAAYRMSSDKIGSLVVVNTKGTPIGIFTSTDGLNALIEVLRGDVLEME